MIDQPGVSTVIPGARNPAQARGNASSAALPPLREDQLEGVRAVYDRMLRPLVNGPLVAGELAPAGRLCSSRLESFYDSRPATSS